MAKVTVTLGQIVNGGTPVFDFDYPMIAGHREQFEQTFIDHYYDQEINFLSVGQFKRRLKAKLQLIMPYYMQMYKSEHLIDNPLRTYKVMESYYREHDNNVFKQGMTYDKMGEKLLTRESTEGRFKSNEDFHLDQSGDTDGTLDRDTTGHSNTDFVSKEHMVQHTDTTNVTDTDGNKVSQEGTDKGVHTETDTVNDGTKDVTSHMTQNVKYHEDTSGTKNTLFSDTPQENFVIGNSAADGTPISSYATTFTRENTTGTKDSNQDTTADSTEHTVTHDTSKSTSQEDTKQTVDYNEDTTEHKDFDEDVDTDRVTDLNSNSVTDTTGTQDDITHGEYTDVKDTNTKFKSHEEGNAQEQTNRDAYNVGQTANDRKEEGKAKYTKSIEGYKMHNESQLLQAFRKTFLNIDRQIIEECNTLFLGVYCLYE